MKKILLILFIISCYEKNINRLSNLFEKGNTFIDNIIIYKVEKTVKVSNFNTFLGEYKLNLTYMKDLNKKKLFIKGENDETLITLENNKMIFKNSDFVLPATNSTTELIYNIFLYSCLELSNIMNILNIGDYKESNLDENLIKIVFKEGYLIYNRKNKTLKELSNIMYDKNIKFENKMHFDYKELNKVLLLSKYKLESKTGDNKLTIEEEIK